MEPPTANHLHPHLCRTLPVLSRTEQAVGKRLELGYCVLGLTLSRAFPTGGGGKSKSEIHNFSGSKALGQVVEGVPESR